jgi:hypothetical protein
MKIASAGDVQRFIERFGSGSFWHADEVMPILRRKDPDESTIFLHDESLDSLRAFFVYPTSPDAPPSSKALAEHLHGARDQPIKVWQIALASGPVYLVFELLEDGMLAGCIKSMPISPDRY